MELHLTNVNQALSDALYNLSITHEEESSRNGPVWVFPEPVTTVYARPRERVLFSPLRDANPFFHFFETLWTLAGRNDIAFLTQFNKNFAQYTDDGVTHPGAYGHRWRAYFGYDQLAWLIRELKVNPDSRRAVLTMWDGGCGADHPQVGANGGTTGDAQRIVAGTKDAPCNTHIYFDRRGGQLNMTVCCRSNDLWWGAYGSNMPVFSTLQELLAFALDVPEGEYRQFSNNLHLYTAVVGPAQLKELAHDADEHDYYLNREAVKPYPLVKHSAERWLLECEQFCQDPLVQHRRFTEPFFTEVAAPLYTAWYYRRKGSAAWQETLNDFVGASDWRIAAQEWCARRAARKEALQNG